MKNIGTIVLNILTLLLAILSGIMALGDQIEPIKALSPKFAMWWPIVLSGALSLKSIATIIRNVVGDWTDDGEINNSYPKKLPLILAACFFLSSCATQQATDPKKVKPPNAYGFSFGLNYSGASFVARREDGRTNFGLDVDAKQVVKAVRRL